MANKTVPGWQRRGKASLEVAEYMQALAAERRKHADEVSKLLIDLMYMQERLDDIANSLGISTDKSDWWDHSTEQKIDKLIGRASMLRCRNQSKTHSIGERGEVEG